MWSCEKECGYWEDGSGCGIDYTPEAFLQLCPCFEMAVTHARDPTAVSGSRVNARGERSERTSSAGVRCANTR